MLQVRRQARIKGRRASSQAVSEPLPDGIWGIGTQSLLGTVLRTLRFTVFNHGVWHAVGAFHFLPVRPGVLLPHPWEVLADKFIGFLATRHLSCTRRGTEAGRKL